MKKVVFVLLCLLLLTIAFVTVSAVGDEFPAIYTYDGEKEKCEITLLDDSNCTLKFEFEEGDNAAVTCNYRWEDGQLVISAASKEIVRFNAEGSSLSLADSSDTTIEPTVEEINETDYSTYIRYFLEYIKSGDAPQELVNAFITMGEEMKKMETEGYTFWERLAQLITPENILTFATALCLIIVSVVFLVWRRKNKSTELDINDILLLLDSISKKQTSNDEAKIGELKEISEMKNNVARVLNMASLAANGSLAVAKMMKDVFLCSRTLDADGKALVIRNYVEAVEGLTGGNDEQSNEGAPS